MSILNPEIHADALELDTSASSVGFHARLSGLFEFLGTSLYRRAHRERDSEIARFLEANGGKLTDELEREMSRRFGGIVGHW